jgi:formylglycine-generating enzyme required for sulfatase activity
VGVFQRKSVGPRADEAYLGRFQSRRENGLNSQTGAGKMRQVEAMDIRAKWEQTTRWLDELPQARAGMLGFFVFLGAGLLILRLPTWGFWIGLCSLLSLLSWLALSGKPVVKLTWPTEAALVEPLEMIELPGGEFDMGSPATEKGRYDDEVLHRVRVSAFAMAKVQVTQKLYQEVMKLDESPSEFKGPEMPVEKVSWFDAVRFCNKLSEQVGLRACYRIREPGPEDGPEDKKDAQPEVEWDRTADGYRLPTEAEWEYACRAGTKTAYSFGDDPAQLGEYAWFGGNSEGHTHEVGTRKPNPWGLHDLHGNVREWCWDWYGDYKESGNGMTNDKVTDDKSPIVNPIGSATGSVRVLRGGSYGDVPRNLRAANRDRYVPVNQLWLWGFRCVRGGLRQH